MKRPFEPQEFTSHERALLKAWDESNAPLVDSAFEARLLAAYREEEETSLRAIGAYDDAICLQMASDAALEDIFNIAPRKTGPTLPISVVSRKLWIFAIVTSSTLSALMAIIVMHCCFYNSSIDHIDKTVSDDHKPAMHSTDAISLRDARSWAEAAHVIFDERAALGKFQAAFTDLLGRDAFIPTADMAAFTDFILRVSYPPNSNRSLDNALTADEEAGRQLFNATNCGISPPEGVRGILTCASCHILDPTGNPETGIPGFIGTTGISTFDFENQFFKVPHLRNLYQKIGMHRNPDTSGALGGDHRFKGDQVRGFGFLHDGTVDTVFHFHHGPSFSVVFTGEGNGSLLEGPEGELQRRRLEAFMLAFPSNLAPIVGQQITLARSSSAAVAARIDLLRQRADASECDLVAKAVVDGAEASRTDRLLLGSPQQNATLSPTRCITHEPFWTPAGRAVRNLPPSLRHNSATAPWPTRPLPVR